MLFTLFGWHTNTTRVNDLETTTQTYLNLIVLADGHAADVVLLAQLLRQRRGHQLSADVRRRAEVALAVLAAVGRDMFVELHSAGLCLLRAGELVSD